MPLTKLPATTIKLITSTQIISSVASVVKELIENSLDAGARNIDIKLENNGLELIEVRDDGCGVKRCDASNMALPNYTSKINDYSDLDKLGTYGFRGEALNALCQVASVSITTRTYEDDYAMTYTLDSSGCVLVSKPSSLGKGTVVTVKRLFYNLPVRKQYLTSNRRRTGEELKRVENVVKSLAVIHPQIRVTFCHDKCLLWQKSACQNLRQSLMQVASHFITNELDDLCMEESNLSIKMLIPKKTIKNIQPLCQSNNEAIMIYINKRPIRYKKLEKMVIKYVSQRFPEQLPLHRYPACLISIVTPSSELDVNLEPNKTQVMLKEEEEVLSRIGHLLATYYEIVEYNSEKNELDVPENLNTSSSSETSLNDTDNGNANERLCEDKPIASKRMKMDPALEKKKFSGSVQNTRIGITQPSKEAFSNCDNSSQSTVKFKETSRELCHFQNTFDGCETKNPAQVISGNLNEIEANNFQNSDDISRSENCEISEFQNLGSGQNFNCENYNLENSGSIENVNSEMPIPENSGVENINYGTSNSEMPLPETSECFENVNCEIFNSEMPVPENSGSFDNVNCQRSNAEMPIPENSLPSKIVNTGILENSASGKRLGSSTSKYFDPSSSNGRKDIDISSNIDNDNDKDMLGITGNSNISLPSVLKSKTENGSDIVRGSMADVGNKSNRTENETTFIQDELDDSLFDVERISDLDFVNLDIESNSCLPTVPEIMSQNEDLCAKNVGSESNSNLNKEESDNMHEFTDPSLEKWSMGLLKAQNGKMLQGSAVLLPKATVEAFNTSCQSVSSQMGQKQFSAFTKFSREERPKILKEFPGIAFTKVAQLLAERWRALPPEEVMRYEQIAKEVDEKRKNKMLEVGLQKLDTFIKELNAPKSKPCKSKKMIVSTKEESELQPKNELKTEKKPKRPKRRKEMFEVSIESLKKVCLQSNTKPRRETSSLSLIGKLKTNGEWLYKRDNELGVVCHWGLQEIVLYHRLLMDHAVPLKKLDSKILLEESLLGPDLWNVLLSLPKAYDVVDNAVIITSDVISKNGFKIEVQEGRSSCMLTEVASTINFYGVNDLKDVLKLVKNHGCESLQKCRNLRVMSYIKDEAVRIVRQCSAAMERDTLQDLINYWQLNLSHLGATCIHRKPIFHVLKNLSKEK